MQELLTFPAKELTQENDIFLTLTLDVGVSPTDAEQDSIKFGNLVKEAKTKVVQEKGEEVWEKLHKQIAHLEGNNEFWRNYSGGLVFYVTPEECYYYRLGVKIGQKCHVSNEPYVLPLINDFQFVNHYHLLALNNDGFKLFTGRRYQLEEVELEEDAPNTIEKALGTERTGGELNVSPRVRPGNSRAGMFHGHNSTSTEKEIDQKNMYNIIDKYVYENFSKSSEWPLVVFALPENQAVFRGVSDNEFLSEEMVEKSSAQLTNQQIEDEAKGLVEEVVKKRHQQLLEDFEETVPALKLGEQLDDLAMASVKGQIEYLLIRDDYVVKGEIGDNGRHIESEKEDYLNALALNVLKTNGRVYILTAREMPALENIMAGLRY